MKQLLIKKGRVYAEEVPAPTITENTVLVRVYYSCISAGTEMSDIASSGESLIAGSINGRSRTDCTTQEPHSHAVFLERERRASLARWLRRFDHFTGQNSSETFETDCCRLVLIHASDRVLSCFASFLYIVGWLFDYSHSNEGDVNLFN